jgi:hypothetical protein
MQRVAFLKTFGCRMDLVRRSVVRSKGGLRRASTKNRYFPDLSRRLRKIEISRGFGEKRSFGSNRSVEVAISLPIFHSASAVLSSAAA